MLTLLALIMIAGIVVVPRFVGFRSQRPEHFAALGPAFDLHRNLSGPMLCEGVLYGPTGRVTSRFVAEMEGKWDGNQGVLTERFLYDNGERQDREWRLSVGQAGTLRAEADDLVGPGVGRISGPTFQMLYNFRLPRLRAVMWWRLPTGCIWPTTEPS